MSSNKSKNINLKKLTLAVIDCLIPIVVMIFSQVLSIIAPPKILSILTGVSSDNISDIKNFSYYYIVLQALIYMIVFILLMTLFLKVYYKENIFKQILKGRINIKWIMIPAVYISIIDFIYFIFVNGEFIFSKVDNESFFVTLIYLVLFTSLAAPIIEELIFRGVIAERVKEKYGKNIALIISSILFALCHNMNARFNDSTSIIMFISITLIGVLLFIIKDRFDSLYASIIFHSIYNLLSEIVPIASKANYNKYWPVSYQVNSDNILLTGGEYGTTASIITICVTIIIIFLVIYLSKNKKYE